MSLRLEYLKNCCLVATIHQRMIALGLRPDNPRDLAQVDVRREFLLHALTDYFAARWIDLRRPGGTVGTYAPNIAGLAAWMVGKGKETVFLGPGIEAAIAVLDRLLAAEGWALRDAPDVDHAMQWYKGIDDVAGSEDRAARQRQIERLFTRHWRFLAREDGTEFKAEEAWGRKIGIWPSG